MPTTLVTVCGALTGWLSSRSWRPGTFVASVIAEVRGMTSRNVLCERPPLSVTVR